MRTSHACTHARTHARTHAHTHGTHTRSYRNRCRFQLLPPKPSDTSKKVVLPWHAVVDPIEPRRKLVSRT